MYVGTTSITSQWLDRELFMINVECLWRELSETRAGEEFTWSQGHFFKVPYCSMVATEWGWWEERGREIVGGGRDGSVLCLAEGCTCCVTDRQTSVRGLGNAQML